MRPNNSLGCSVLFVYSVVTGELIPFEECSDEADTVCPEDPTAVYIMKVVLMHSNCVSLSLNGQHTGIVMVMIETNIALDHFY